MFDRLKVLCESVLYPKEREQIAKEVAIAAWENNLETNADNYKVVRGADGRPVEIIMKNEHRAAFVVNGKEKAPFDAGKLTGGSFNDPIPGLCLSGELGQAYDVVAVQRLDFDERKAIYVLTGTAMGGQPGLVVRG